MNRTSPSRSAKREVAVSYSWSFLLYAVEFCLLSVLYVVYIDYFWSYLGFLTFIDWRRIALSLVVILSFVVVAGRKDTTRAFCLNFVIMTCIIPSLVLFSVGAQPFSSSLVIWTAFMIAFVVSAIPLPALVAFSMTPLALSYSLLALSIVTIASYPLLGGMTSFNLDLSQVYDFRDDAALALPGLFGYISPTFGKIVLPFAMAISLYYKRYGAALIFAGCSILLFGFTSHKGPLFYPIVTLVIFFGTQRIKKLSTLVLLFNVLLCVSLIDTYVARIYGDEYSSGMYSNLLVRRALMIPALLNYDYIDFFSQGDWYFWSTSKLTMGLVPIPYMLTPQSLIGAVFFGSDEANANTGFIGSGYAQAGIWGMIVYAVGVGLVVAIISAHGRRLGLPLVAAMMTNLIFTMFAATDFLALFLTHGMLVALLLLSVTASPEPGGRKHVRSHRQASPTGIRASEAGT